MGVTNIKSLIKQYGGKPPKAKYKLFQTVKQGEIVGIEWVGLQAAWEHRWLPGWHYTIQGDDDRVEVHESEVE